MWSSLEKDISLNFWSLNSELRRIACRSSKKKLCSDYCPLKKNQATTTVKQHGYSRRNRFDSAATEIKWTMDQPMTGFFFLIFLLNALVGLLTRRTIRETNKLTNLKIGIRNGWVKIKNWPVFVLNCWMEAFFDLFWTGRSVEWLNVFTGVLLRKSANELISLLFCSLL